jgi:hypothetical protein
MRSEQNFEDVDAVLYPEVCGCCRNGIFNCNFSFFLWFAGDGEAIAA